MAVTARFAKRFCLIRHSRHILGRPSQSDMTTVTLTLANGLEPSRSKICRIWRTGFYIDVCATVWTVALRWAIFKRKKGFATISLRLNYCSMGSFCHDLVRLSFKRAPALAPQPAQKQTLPKSRILLRYYESDWFTVARIYTGI
jgi:hypothetical protein